ncbi:RagB/SusD family nutrient uptake outer membrane protein [Bacteroides sp.]|uniref:RagB/SusD family nutrient uptake outer membrane protein n=1 Tax=Bacteroides sp. TaxID=29523 RepID=UPI002617921D|nr:RagB/SusD family nutrient uptake outer membrane protein [Bacteroides sp.]MDD3038018.1 RagB/SusD family nutrient uptake outer membrane protein [Bacteroides sp.]
MKLKFLNIYTIAERLLLNVFCCASLLAGMSSCNAFLDIVPDDVANLDHAFSNKYEAERFLFSCYKGMTSLGNQSLFGADDIWADDTYYSSVSGFKLASGGQNISDPLLSIWTGSGGASFHAYNNIYNCNIFIERASDLSQIPDLDEFTRKQWIAEAKFLKAYYHYCLFRMYGPIPVLDKNYEVQASMENLSMKREPVDDVVNYISNLLMEASDVLPLTILNTSTELGRPTKGATLALRAKLLVTAASPLFNGNKDYKGIKDKDGVILFPQEKEINKWKEAVEACELALKNIPGVDFYEYTALGANEMSQTTRYKMRTRGVVTDRWNCETILGINMSKATCYSIQQNAMIPYIKADGAAYFWSLYSVPINMAERFYTKNGVPLSEDKEWNNKWEYTNRYKTTQVGSDQLPNLVNNYVTARLNVDRENRFYASLTFDGSMLYMKSNSNENDAIKVNSKFGALNGRVGLGFLWATGYVPTKLVNFGFEGITSAPGYTTDYYNWPEIRLSDLYLLYAEALNEVEDSQTNRDKAIRQLNEIRSKTGLKGVKESWLAYSNQPDKPNSQDGLREIIHQEREIELAFEGHRIWDLRRWKEAEIYQNNQIKGWNMLGKTAESYYTIVPLADQRFISPRDYLWPIKESEMQINKKLVQNPGW